MFLFENNIFLWKKVTTTFLRSELVIIFYNFIINKSVFLKFGQYILPENFQGLSKRRYVLINVPGVGEGV